MIAELLNSSGGSREIQKALHATSKRSGSKEAGQKPHASAEKGAGCAQRLKRSWHLKGDGRGWKRWEADGCVEGGGDVCAAKSEKGIRYTDDEYRRLIAPLKSSDKWTKQETDYLMDLVDKCNITWPIIIDKYRYPPKPPTNTAADMRDVGETETETETETEEDDDDDDDDITGRRDLVDLKDRYYSICHSLAHKQPHTEAETNTTKKSASSIKYIFDPVGEIARRKQAEARYEVNSLVADREEKLRNILGILQELSKRLESDASMDIGPKELPADFSQLLNSATEGGKYAESELNRLERDLLPLRNVIDGVYRSKGAVLASQLIKQSSDVFGCCVHPQKKNAHTGGGGASTLSSRGANTPASVMDLHSAKEVNEGIEKILRNACKDWSQDNTRELANGGGEHPASYFQNHLQRFSPPVNTRSSLEAYTELRLNAAVCYQLKKQLDQLDTMHDKWVNKLLEVRKNLRTARRAVAKVPPTKQMGANDPIRWKPASRPPSTAR